MKFITLSALLSKENCAEKKRDTLGADLEWMIVTISQIKKLWVPSEQLLLGYHGHVSPYRFDRLPYMVSLQQSLPYNSVQ